MRTYERGKKIIESPADAQFALLPGFKTLRNMPARVLIAGLERENRRAEQFEKNVKKTKNYSDSAFQILQNRYAKCCRSRRVSIS
jgi:hypothetical protein